MGAGACAISIRRAFVLELQRARKSINTGSFLGTERSRSLGVCPKPAGLSAFILYTDY